MEGTIPSAESVTLSTVSGGGGAKQDEKMKGSEVTLPVKAPLEDW